MQTRKGVPTIRTHQGAFRWTEDDIRKIRFAVLDSALNEAFRKGETDPQTIRWIHANDAHPFSFVACCHEFKLDEEAVRQKIQHRLGTRH